jgi:sialidase-1
MNDPAWRASVPGPGGAIQTREGRLIVPVWKSPYANFVIFSDDYGNSWRRSRFVPGDQGGNENQVVELSDGRVLMDIRQSQGPRRWLTESVDGGQTWAKCRPGLEVTPVMCAIERFPAWGTGDTAPRLLWTGPKGPERRQLVLRASYDDGKSFTTEQRISDRFAAYSDLTVLKDQTVGILWERGVQRGYEFITFTRLRLD